MENEIQATSRSAVCNERVLVKHLPSTLLGVKLARFGEYVL